MPIIGNKDTLIVKLAFQKWEKWLVPVLWQSPRLFWEVVGYFLFLSQRKLPSCKSHLKVLGILKTNKSIVYILPKTSLFYKGCFESYFSLSEKTVTMLLIFGKLYFSNLKPCTISLSKRTITRQIVRSCHLPRRPCKNIALKQHSTLNGHICKSQILNSDPDSGPGMGLLDLDFDFDLHLALPCHPMHVSYDVWLYDVYIFWPPGCVHDTNMYDVQLHIHDPDPWPWYIHVCMQDAYSCDPV